MVPASDCSRMRWQARRFTALVRRQIDFLETIDETGKEQGKRLSVLHASIGCHLFDQAVFDAADFL